MDKELLRKILKECWGDDTNLAVDGNIAGQGTVTALVVQDIMGGDIMRTSAGEEWHFYNMENGVRYDYVGEELGIKIEYEDLLTDRDDLVNVDGVFEKYGILKRRVVKILKEHLKKIN